MLIGIDPILNADILHALRAMGHGDELVIADGSFPAQTVAKRLIRMEAADLPRMLTAVLSVMPVDGSEPDPVIGMEVIDEPDTIVAAHVAIRKPSMRCPAKRSSLPVSSVSHSTTGRRKPSPSSLPARRCFTATSLFARAP